MAFCMSIIHDESGKYGHSIKFLKRLYFCAKLLDDFEGAEIAINKIGISYFMMGEYEKSLNFHSKHMELLGQKHAERPYGKAISLYNQAVCFR